MPQAHASAEVNLHNDSSELELHKNMHQTEMLHHIWVRTCKLMHRSRCCSVIALIHAPQHPLVEFGSNCSISSGRQRCSAI
jgi:hypothetical protein